MPVTPLLVCFHILAQSLTTNVILIPGHTLINSTTGTSKGTFSAEIQKCEPCGTQTQFILNPNTDTCQPCPAGLICDGTARVVPRVNGSKWITEGDHYVLESCPYGFYVFNSTVIGLDIDDPSIQECKMCDPGQECTKHECEVCTLCKPGHYKDSASTTPCTECPRNSYRSDPGAVRLGNCLNCPTDTSTKVDVFDDTKGFKTGQTHVENCTCDRFFYLSIRDNGMERVCMTCPNGATCADGSCGLWDKSQTCRQGGTNELITGTWRQEPAGADYRLIQCPAGHSLVNSVNGVFNHDAQQCRKCESGEYIMDPNRETCKPCPAGMTCANNFYTAKVPTSRWETVLRRPPESLRSSNALENFLVLRECPIGYLLVNHTLEAQECRRCEPTTYSFNPTDGCKLVSGVVLCEPRDCQACPIGARCAGGSLCVPGQPNCVFTDGFQPLYGSTQDWSRAIPGKPQQPVTPSSALGSSMVYRLESCPQGHILVRNENEVEQDTCVPCPANTYSVRPASYSGNFLTVTSQTEVRDTCKLCPSVAECRGGDQIVPNIGYWKWDGWAVASDAVARRNDDFVNSTAVTVYRCPVDACLEGGECREGHMNPVCGLCKPGYALAGKALPIRCVAAVHPMC